MVLRRLSMILITLLMTLVMVSCSASTSDLSIEEIEETLLNLVPRFVNDDFELPTIKDLRITWTYEDETITDLFPYVSPMIETNTQLIAAIKNGLTTTTLAFPITLVPAESGRNARVMRIETDVPIDQIDRETYVDASLMATTDRNGTADLEIVTDMVRIRGRGNSSWFTYPKKPYRLRFDEKTSLFGLTPAKNYVLLAEYGDKSLLRNTLAFKFAQMMEHLTYTPESRSIEVYFNGVYEGVYTLTEQVEVYDGKVELDTSPDRIDTGYFVELDMRFYEQNEVVGTEWFKIGDVPYQIKEPKYDEPGFTTAHNTFIKHAFESVQDALATGRNVDQYLDIDNAIDYFIVMELFKNVDVGYSSVFIQKAAGDVVRLGPVWDFDISTGNIDYIPDYGPEGFYGTQPNKNVWFRLLMQDETLRMRFKARYEIIYEEKIPLLLDILDNLGQDIRPLAFRNFERHEILGTYVWPNPPEVVAINTHAGQVAYVKDFLEIRSAWLYTTMQTSAYRNGVYFQ